MAKVKCRTCFQMLKPNYQLSLKTTVALGKTVEEILHFFIPEMAKSNLIDEFVCPRCMKDLKIFMNFIKKFIDVENYLKAMIIRQQQVQQNILKGSGNEARKKKSTTDICHKNCVNTKKPNYEKLQKMMKEKLDEMLKDPDDREKSRKGRQLSNNEDTNFVKPLKTYTSIKRNCQPTSQEEPIQLPDFPNSEPNPVLDDDDNISCEDIAETPPNSSEQQQDLIFHNSADESTTRSQICESCGGNLGSDSCSNIKCIKSKSRANETLDVNIKEGKVEENTKCIDLPSDLPTGAGEIYTDYSETASKTSTSFLMVKLEDGTLIRTVPPEFFNFPVNGDRNCTLSVAAKETEIVDFLKNYTNHNINLVKLDSQQKTGRKRILFLGKALMFCSECKKYFPSRQSIGAHIREQHPSNVFASKNERKRNSYKRSKECPVCKAKFRGDVLLEKHVTNQHKELYLYTCDKCERKFKRGVLYRQHLKNYELYQDCSIRKCGICGKLVNRELYLKHRRTHQDVECDICKYKFATHTELDLHRLKIHTDLKPREKSLCPICGKLVFKSRLRCHLKFHTDTRSYLCEKCSKFFKTSYCLRRHNDRVHADTGPFQCSICMKKTKTMSALKCHIRLKHFEVHSHVCDICGAGFTRGDYYRRHLRQHLYPERCRPRGGRSKKYCYTSTQLTNPIPCKYCNKKFYRVDKLRLHLLTKHITNRERSKCQYCSMTFSNPRNRMRHEKRHEDPVAFELTCKVCYNRFGSKEELDVHSAKHKKSQRRICEICGEAFPSKHFLQHHKGEKHFDKEALINEKSTVLREGLSHVMVGRD